MRKRPPVYEMAAAGRVRRALMIACFIVIVLLALWASIALWYQGPDGRVGRSLLITLWLAFTAVLLYGMVRGRGWLPVLVFVIAFAGVLVWWQRLRPSNDRDWADDVARTVRGEIDGDVVTLHDLRNFDWRSNTDYTQRWETRRYDLRRLEGVDMITSYWTGPAIAHVLVSFGFTDGQHVVFSVEIRREKSEEFSELGGFFKEFELSVIAADERDVIRVRTNVRGEDDYLYRINLPPDAARSLFLAYVEEANRLATTPRYYNTITVNCTTLVYHMVNRIVGRLPLSYRLLFSGFLPEYVHAVGGLDPRYRLPELRTMGRITERAQRSNQSEAFSQDIRAGIPVLVPAQ
jgi:Domain of unknown function (DUF4105)